MLHPEQEKFFLGLIPCLGFSVSEAARGYFMWNLAHRFFLPTNSQVTLSMADTLQEKRKLAKSADCVGGAHVLGRECFISTAIGASG